MPKTAAASKANFPAVFDALRGVLRAQSKGMKVEVDSAKTYYVNTNEPHPSGKGLIFFAAVKINASYVSYHLMPLYIEPALRKSVSPALKRHLHGKACFNFKTIEPAVLMDLAAITKLGASCFKKLGPNILGAKKSA